MFILPDARTRFSDARTCFSDARTRFPVHAAVFVCAHMISGCARSFRVHATFFGDVHSLLWCAHSLSDDAGPTFPLYNRALCCSSRARAIRQCLTRAIQSSRIEEDPCVLAHEWTVSGRNSKRPLVSRRAHVWANVFAHTKKCSTLLKF